MIFFNRAKDQTKPYPVAISPEMIQRIEDCLKELEIQPVDHHRAPLIKPEEGQEPHVSLLVSFLIETLRNRFTSI